MDGALRVGAGATSEGQGEDEVTANVSNIASFIPFLILFYLQRKYHSYCLPSILLFLFLFCFYSFLHFL